MLTIDDSPILLIRADADQSSSSQVNEDVRVEQAHQDSRADQNCSRASSSSRDAVFDQGISNGQNGNAEEEFKVSRNFCLDSSIFLSLSCFQNHLILSRFLEPGMEHWKERRS